MLFRPSITDPEASGVINGVTAAQAGWSLLNIAVHRLAPGECWEHETGETEAAVVLLGGVCSVRSSRGEWPSVGRRADVFAGMPYALYLPRRTAITLTALTRVELAHGWAPTDRDHPARLVRPQDCPVEIRGGHGATRQINGIIPPGFGCHRIVAVEVFTPGGNWSSYPPHKHDTHREDGHGNILEADLEEVYYYRFSRPQGFAFQRVYTEDLSRDAAFVCRQNDIVLVPEGYHPVAAAYGYDCYYLNFLAGSAQSLAYSDDPVHVWTKDGWTAQDLRLPLVDLSMEER